MAKTVVLLNEKLYERVIKYHRYTLPDNILQSLQFKYGKHTTDIVGVSDTLAFLTYQEALADNPFLTYAEYVEMWKEHIEQYADNGTYTEVNTPIIKVGDEFDVLFKCKHNFILTTREACSVLCPHADTCKLLDKAYETMSEARKADLI